MYTMYCGSNQTYLYEHALPSDHPTLPPHPSLIYPYLTQKRSLESRKTKILESDSL